MKKIFICMVALVVALGFSIQVTGGKVEASNPAMTIYVVPAVTDVKILPTSEISSGYISDKLLVTAAPGEFEPASFVIRAHDDINSLTVEATDLTGASGSIPSFNVDIRVVKCWYQVEEKFRGSGRILTPELLLKDDTLVKVEGGENYLKLTSGEYVWISEDRESPASEWNTGIDELPVRDAESLQPVDIPAGTNKQFWITVRVPNSASAGMYTGTIRLNTDLGPAEEIEVQLQIFPIVLSKPSLIYNLYYYGMLDPAWPDGSISRKYKSEQQLRAELNDLFEHGITHPMMSQYWNNTELFTTVLGIIKETGFETEPLFIQIPERNLGYGAPQDSQTLEQLRQEAEQVISIAQAEGFSDIYFYGIDEAAGDTLTAQRLAWEAIHQAGGKVFVAGRQGKFPVVGDILDLLNCADKPSAAEAAEWHDAGKLITCYAYPQAGYERPETYRRNYGLLLWQTDYDGAMDWAYQGAYATIWNEFDWMPGQPDIHDYIFAYPTIDGVIDTIQWEGWREGVDDIRYLTTLLETIEQAKAAGKDTSSAEIWLADLKGADLGGKDLDSVRLEIIAHTLDLLGETSDTVPPEFSSVTATEISPISARITWTTDELSTTQLEYGITEDLGQTTELDTAFAINHAISLTGLSSSTIYYYRVKSGDITGNLAISDTYSFTTLPPFQLSASFIAPTDADNGVVIRDWTEINVSIDSDCTMVSGFIDWDRSLVGYWDFSENSGQTAYDRSTYGSNGILTNGPQWTTGKFGYALKLDGVDDHVKVNGFNKVLDTGSSSFTMEAWVNIPATQEAIDNIIMGKTGYHSGLIVNNRTIQFQLYNTANSIYRTNYIMPELNTWYHVVGIYNKDESKIYLYVNGSMVSEKSFTGDIRDYSDTLFIGGYGNNYYSTAATVDEMKIWNRALSAEEIEASYNAKTYGLSHTFTGLADGTYQYYAHATDLMGNSVQTPVRTITVSINPDANQQYDDCDVNSDLKINVLDMILVGQHWNETGLSGWIREDVIDDGVINILDMIFISQRWIP